MSSRENPPAFLQLIIDMARELPSSHAAVGDYIYPGSIAARPYPPPKAMCCLSFAAFAVNVAGFDIRYATNTENAI